MFDSFKDPPPEHRIHVLWIWNALLDKDEIKRQIREFHAQGFGGFVIEHHPDANVDNDEAALVESLDCAARAAAGLGMRAYLHDNRQPSAPSWSEEWSKFVYFQKRREAQSRNDTARENFAAMRRFAERTWNMTIEDAKRAIDWQMALGGSTVLAPQIPFLIRRSPQDVHSRFYHAPAWPYQRLLTDYAARLSYAMSQGRNKAQVALLDTGANPRESAADLAAHYTDLYSAAMLREHISYDIITDEELGRASCLDQRLKIDDNDYELLIIPPAATMRPQAVRRVREFADDGGALVGTVLLPHSDSQGVFQPWISNTFHGIFGTDPALLPESCGSDEPQVPPYISEAGNALFFPPGSVVEIEERLRTWLEKLVRFDVSARRLSAECPDIAVAHRVTDSGELYFFANGSGEPREVRLAIRCTGAPHLLDPETGDVTALPNCTQRAGKTLLLYRFERYSSLLVFFGPEPSFNVKRYLSSVDAEEIATLGAWQSFPDDSRRSYVKNEVFIPTVSQGRAVLVGADGVDGVAEFTVNGVSAGIRAWAPFEVDITHLVSPGERNSVEVHEVRTSDSPPPPGSPTARVCLC